MTSSGSSDSSNLSQCASLVDPNEFVEAFAKKNGLPLQAGNSTTEKRSITFAQRAREEYKCLQAKKDSARSRQRRRDRIIARGTDQDRSIQKRKNCRKKKKSAAVRKNEARLRCNRKSGYGNKVYNGVIKRLLSAMLLRHENTSNCETGQNSDQLVGCDVIDNWIGEHDEENIVNGNYKYARCGTAPNHQHSPLNAIGSPIPQVQAIVSDSSAHPTTNARIGSAMITGLEISQFENFIQQTTEVEPKASAQLQEEVPLSITSRLNENLCQSGNYQPSSSHFRSEIPVQYNALSENRQVTLPMVGPDHVNETRKENAEEGYVAPYQNEPNNTGDEIDYALIDELLAEFVTRQPVLDLPKQVSPSDSVNHDPNKLKVAPEGIGSDVPESRGNLRGSLQNESGESIKSARGAITFPSESEQRNGDFLLDENVDNQRKESPPDPGKPNLDICEPLLGNEVVAQNECIENAGVSEPDPRTTGEPNKPQS